VEKYSTARPAIYDNIERLMSTAFRITKSKGTNSEYLILIALPIQQRFRE